MTRATRLASLIGMLAMGMVGQSAAEPLARAPDVAVVIPCPDELPLRDACSLAACVGLGINFVGWGKNPKTGQWALPDGQWVADELYVLKQLDHDTAVGLLLKHLESDKIYFRFLAGYTVIHNYCSLTEPL